MSLQIHTPPDPLGQYVAMMWQWPGYHPPHAQERILPFGMMELTINLSGAPFCVFDPARDEQPQRIHHAMVVGARSRFFVIDTSRPVSLLSVWFRPGGALPFFGVSGADLHNLHLPLSELWGYEAEALVEGLSSARTVRERFTILEGVLLARLYRSMVRHRAVDYALQTFVTQPQTAISTITDRLALSPTRFIDVFRDDIGLTPKLFTRVQRFQQASQLIAGGQVVDWTDVALACGYYDQSHFINEFRRFAGMPPSAYAPQDPDHHANVAYEADGG